MLQYQFLRSVILFYFIILFSPYIIFSQCLSGDCNNGKGVYQYLNGGKYEGSFKNGLENGFGLIVFTSGAKYEGEWLNGKKNGKGKYYYNTGEYYEGGFMSGLMHGKGKFQWSNGNIYEGVFQYDKISGQGVYRWINGDWYEGEFSDGLLNGKGIYYHSNGDVFEGEWVNNDRTGWGKYTSKNGTIEEGYYEKGTLTKSIEVKNKSQGLTEKQIEEIDLSQDVISSDDAKTKENVRQFLYGPTTSSATNKTVENNNTKNEVNNSEIKYINCDFQILKPKLNFTFVDNRTLCCICKKRYSEYSKNSEYTLNYEEVSYLTEILYLHHQKIGASNEHIKNDLNRLTDFIADNYKGLSSMGLIMAPAILYATQIPLFTSFGQEIGSKNRKVDLYDVEKFCSACMRR
jgi:hypothetical protein